MKVPPKVRNGVPKSMIWIKFTFVKSNIYFESRNSESLEHYNRY